MKKTRTNWKDVCVTVTCRSRVFMRTTWRMRRRPRDGKDKHMLETCVYKRHVKLPRMYAYYLAYAAASEK